MTLKFDKVFKNPKGNRNMWSKLKNSKKVHIRSTLTLGARKSVKVIGQVQGHIWKSSLRGIKWFMFQVSILIRTEVMTQNVFWTFFGDLDLDIEFFVIRLHRNEGHICVYYWVNGVKSNRNTDAARDDWNVMILSFWTVKCAVDLLSKFQSQFFSKTTWPIYLKFCEIL